MQCALLTLFNGKFLIKFQRWQFPSGKLSGSKSFTFELFLDEDRKDGDEIAFIAILLTVEGTLLKIYFRLGFVLEQGLPAEGYFFYLLKQVLAMDFSVGFLELLLCTFLAILEKTIHELEGHESIIVGLEPDKGVHFVPGVMGGGVHLRENVQCFQEHGNGLTVLVENVIGA